MSHEKCVMTHFFAGQKKMGASIWGDVIGKKRITFRCNLYIYDNIDTIKKMNGKMSDFCKNDILHRIPSF